MEWDDRWCSLVFGDNGIVGCTDDEPVAKCFGAFEERDVSDVEQVPASGCVGDNHVR